MRAHPLISTLLLTASSLAFSQQTQQKQPSPEEMRLLMQATMGAMVPVMGQMTEAMIDAQLRMAERPETIERIATFKRSLYESLLKKGFTGDQAIQIVLTTALPSATPSAK